MILKREGNKRGHLNIGWLDAKYSFSFGSYFDPAWMGFGPLRVINEDFIAPGKGFDPHQHKDMEIISFICEGELSHKDTLGNESVIKPGEIQIMSAGSGITHSEHNSSLTTQTHSFQIWIEPNQKNLPPRYEQYQYTKISDGFTKLVSSKDEKNVARISQDVEIELGDIMTPKVITLENRKYWVQLIDGEMKVNGIEIRSGDALAIDAESELEIIPTQQSKFLFFKL